MLTGVLMPLAALGALLLNVNFVLSGIGQIDFDLPYMVAEILMILGYCVVGAIASRSWRWIERSMLPRWRD